MIFSLVSVSFVCIRYCEVSMVATVGILFFHSEATSFGFNGRRSHLLLCLSLVGDDGGIVSLF